MIPDPVEVTGLPLWVICIILGLFSFFVTLYWPVEEPPIIIDLGESEQKNLTPEHTSEST